MEIIRRFYELKIGKKPWEKISPLSALLSLSIAAVFLRSPDWGWPDWPPAL
jgi:hypothetical protein